MQKFLPRLNQLAASIALVAGGVALMPTAQAAAPTAGSNISNIATASYTDGNGASKTVTSNEVKTTVLQVSSFTLVADRNATINPNGTATLSHTLTNTGNGTDTFTLSVTQLGGSDDVFDLTNVHIYLDSNQDGVPDNNTDINSVTLTANQSVGIIVVSTVPVTRADGDKAKYTLNATAVFDQTVKASNTDTVTVSAGASMQIQKSASVSSVAPNGDITYTLTYKNTGNGAAPFVTIKDALPTTVTYNAGSGLWSGSSTPLNDDAVASDPTGIDYRYDSATQTVLVSLTNVPANSTGTVKFTVKAKAGNNSNVYNTASIFIDDDSDPTNTPTNTTPTQSNQTTVTPTSTYTGTINDSANDVYADVDKVTSDANKDDQILSVTSQGVPVVFGDNAGSTDTGPDLIVVHNTGTATETFNVTYDKSDLPAGSIVELFKADGATPLTDTNGDGIVDTGPLAALATAQIKVKVTLPTSHNTVVNSATSDDVIVTIKPASDSTALADTIKLSIVDVTPATVDLFNNDNTDTTTGTKTPGATGLDTGSPVESISVAGGQPAVFQIDVKNSGATPDNFNLTNSTLPPGWTVQYFKDDGNGNPTGSALTNTGNIAPGTTVNLVAVVTPPANAPVSTTPVVFTVTSPVTGLSDSLTDEVKVKETRQLTLVSDNIGQVAPGGTVTYTHTLTNNGNILEGATDGSLPFTLSNDKGWNTTLYVDLNGNGIADANELVSGTDIGAVLKDYDLDADTVKGLEAGQSVKLIVKVEAPATAVAGTQDTATLTVSPIATTAGTQQSPLTNIDLTTVNDGQIRLVKEQALDAACNGTAVGSFTQNNLSAKPGTCVVYRITATNEGNVPVTVVKINDTVPTYTTLVSGTASNNATVGTVTFSGTASGSAIQNDVGTLNGNAAAQLKFSVRVDQ